MSTGIDLSKLYGLRNDFTIIALTGRTSSGCTQIATQLSKGFNEEADFERPSVLKFKNNSYRKYRIIYNYAKVNFKPYTLIKYRNILTLFLLKYPLQNFIKFIISDELKEEFEKSKFSVKLNFTQEVEALETIKPEFDRVSKLFLELDISNLNSNRNWEKFYEFFFSDSFIELNDKLNNILKSNSLVKRNKTLQIIANNLRISGNPFSSAGETAKNIDTIVELINDLIKCHRKKFVTGKTQIVIDSLRNPFEIMFFKQRLAAFYTIAVNRDDNDRKSNFVSKYTLETEDAEKLVEEEYKGGEDNEFYKQNVSACIEQADIHISFIERKTAQEKNTIILEKNSKNTQEKDNTSPYYSWRMQLLQYISLIGHPGLITPSPEERCMQMAYTAKHNSGCISRHVGAAVTDQNYSIKAIGWNNTPEGQVPCVLRNAEDLIDTTMDLESFTPYEKSNENFKKALKEKFSQQRIDNSANLKGRNICFCFKSLKNSVSEGKNQVHTRSLHAEENAFLQIAKYGGIGIKGGKLFTTASPCELCAKKAYQLGIEVIYYIDPYPGISKKQILDAGDTPIDIRLFNGAIGNAYHWLYDPIMPYKDEMTLLLGNKIKDLTSQYEDQINEKQKEIDFLNIKIKKLEEQISIP